MAAVNGMSLTGVSAADLANMDIESALMLVQTQRANLLESQLKDQMEAVRARNEQINALNSILAEVRELRPGGKAEDKKNTSNGGTVQVPITGSTNNVDAVALAEAQAELTRLQALKVAGNTVATPGGAGAGGGGSSGTLTVPSDFKPTSNSPAVKPYTDALSAYIDGRKATPMNFGTAIGSNGPAITGFLNYYNANKALIDAKYSNPAFSVGFNSGSDSGDIEKAFESNSRLRTEYETYLRLAVQGGGVAAPPGTKIVDTSPAANNPTKTDPAAASNIDTLIKQQEDKIKQLQQGTTITGTQFSSMTLDQALKFYGFTTGDLTQTQYDQLIQTISSRIDGLNSTQQLDMLRLQSLTNKRNEAFDIMTNFIKKMQDSRSSIVGNMR